jgi:class 3 adenylate cyclase/tetratricopeptide (TPR) repeat protein
MGQVFRARDERLHREVALKFLLSRPGLSEEALREARAVARLDHENIVRIFDVSEWSEPPQGPRVPFLVMECLEGESLSALLKRGRLDARRALEILDAVTVGLAHAHERGLVHRDLKPGNVFLTREGKVKLLDFGLSHLLAASAPPAPHLPTAGTPGYMAPEQWRGEPQDVRTDVWAAGVVLYELLTGKLPYVEATLSELRARVLSEEPVPSVRVRDPEVPPEVEALLATALAKEPARRFPTARELWREARELRARLARPGVEVSGPVSQQRRQLVLLACQLTDFAGLARRLDAEDLGELEAAFHQSCVEIVQCHGGSVSLYMGGEVFACFGYPQVREDDAERAVRAALHLTRQLPENLQRRLSHLSLSGSGTRVGLHTDRVVLDGRALRGEAPMVVSWLASQAGPGEVLVGETTWKQVRGAFETKDLGARDFQGLARPANPHVYRVLRERTGRVRFERTLVEGGLTPLVGREHELRRLLELWDGAREGQGAFLLLRGEAGIGKSRLIQELREWVPPETVTRLRLQCWPRLCASAPHPAVEVLQRLLRFSPEGSPQRHLEELEAQLHTLGLSEEYAQLLGLLLGLPVPEGAPMYRLTIERRREKIHEALADLLLGMARRRPVLLAVEDLHWADSSWLEFLGVLLDRIEEAPLLVVLSARPEFQPAWPSRPWLHRLPVERLPAELAATLVKEAARGAPLPEETVRELVGKTDGIPLFIEEMTRVVLEGGEVASIPVTLHELLLARLDLLPSRRKELAQLGAVVGREFSLALLAAVTEGEAADLRRELAGLVEAGLLQEWEGEGEPGYQFRHALFQEAAHQSLSRGERRQHHRRIAQVLVALFPEAVEARPEVLAHHHTEAGEPALAIPYWGRAGQLAFRRMAVPEVVSYLTRALDLLRGLPETRRPPGAELEMLTSLSFSQALLRGFESPEVARTYVRIWELLRREGEIRPQLHECFWSIFSYHKTRAEFLRCHELAELLVHEGERQGSPKLLAAGYWMMALDFMFWGRMRSAREYCERALAVEPSSLKQHEDPSWIESRTHASIIRSVSGRLEEARENGGEAQALARRLGDPFVLWLVLTFADIACMFRREVQEALRLADEIIANSSERNYWQWPAWPRIIRGWALAELGQPREGLVLARQEASRWRALGLQGGRTYSLGVLAGIHLKLGQVREGLTVVREALELMQATGERGFEVELRRLCGELLRAGGSETEGRQELFHAIAVAREQGTLLYELRATVSLGRLLRDTGHSEEARKLLARILARFDESVDSVDLSEARALLEQLSAPVAAEVPHPF